MENNWIVYTSTSIKNKIAGCGIVWKKAGKVVRRAKYRFGEISHPLASLLTLRLAFKPLMVNCTSDDIVVYTPSEYARAAVIGTTKAKKNTIAVEEVRLDLLKLKGGEVRAQAVNGKDYRSAYRTGIEACCFMKDVTDLTYKLERYK